MPLPVLPHQAAQTSVKMSRESTPAFFTIVFACLHIDPWLVARRTPQQHHVSLCVLYTNFWQPNIIGHIQFCPDS